MNPLVGFNAFRTEPTTESASPDFCVYLSEESATVPAGNPYYTVHTEVCNNLFYKNQEGYTLAMIPEAPATPLTLSYPVSGDSTSMQAPRCTITGNTTPVLLQFALWVAFGLFALQHNTVAIHASTVIYKNKAILFLGESGTGKSTHTCLWLSSVPGAELLNDDSPILHIEQGKCNIYGSPWSGKTPCYKQEKAELTAIVRLSQAPHNSIRRLTLHESIGALLPSFPPAFTADKELSAPLHKLLSQVFTQVPAYHLECLPNTGAVQQVLNNIEIKA